MRRSWIVYAPLAILGVLLFIVIGGTVVQLLWNWLLPPLFGWRQITFWQALGLLALCRILFGGFGRHGGSGRHSAIRSCGASCRLAWPWHSSAASSRWCRPAIDPPSKPPA